MTTIVMIGSSVQINGEFVTEEKINEIIYEYRMKLVSGEVEQDNGLESFIQHYQEIMVLKVLFSIIKK